jgi:hypothetical protein
MQCMKLIIYTSLSVGGVGDAANLLYGLILRYFRYLRGDPDI